MIEALLHKKLTFEQENMEDILTSNVFGVLQYASPEVGLFPFLSRAETAEPDGKHEYPLRNLFGASDTVEYAFWPSWQLCDTNGKTQRIEPDVVLHIQSGNGLSYLICIEAKYHSGKSSEAEKISEEAEQRDEAAEESDESEKRISAECKDQLVREWNALLYEAATRNAKPILVYLTADFSCPREQIDASLVEHRTKRINSPEPLICWLSWRELADLFNNATEQPILLAITRMAEEIGLTFFRGISRALPIKSSWVFPSPQPHTLPQVLRFSVAPIISSWQFRQNVSAVSSHIVRSRHQRRSKESTATWFFDMVPIISHWRFKR